MGIAGDPVRRMFVGLTASLALCADGEAVAATVAFNPVADTYLRDATARGGLGFMDVRGGAVDFRGYLRFDLSALPAGAVITGATLRLTQVDGASRNDAIVADRFALYGLDNAPGNTAQDWDEATFVPGVKGAEDVATLSGVTDLDDNVAGIVESIVGAAPSGVITVSGVPLAAFLQGRFGDGGLATFILSNDDAVDRGFGIGTRENGDPLVMPVLTVEYVPGPPAVALLALAGVVAGRRRR